jgi:predicted nucleic acid-binding protein
MKNKAHDLTRYTFSNTDTVLLDTNVWLYLFPAPSGRPPGFAATYSAALKQMLTAKAALALDALILSEYLNRYCRIEWNALHKMAQPDFKKFRKSGAFASVGQGAAIFAQKMLKLCSRHDHPFAATDIARILADFEAGVHDLNDGLLVETCRQHGWKLVTNDGDFTSGGIEVLTSNPRLIAACP